jgi:hypothetical protein
MTDDLPPTVKALEAKIAALEAKLSTGEGLESRLLAKLDAEIKALEAKLTAVKAKEEDKPAQGGGWSKHFWF